MFSYDNGEFKFQLFPGSGLNTIKMANMINKKKNEFLAKTGYTIFYVASMVNKVNYYGAD